MKYKFFLILSIFSLNNACFCAQNTNKSEFSLFLKTLGFVESSNNDSAIGDNGRALGRYQVWRGCFKDAQEFDKSLQNIKYEQLTNKVISDKVVKAYILRYEPRGNYESWAKLINGGPNWRKATGQKKKNLDIYWTRFQKQISVL